MEATTKNNNVVMNKNEQIIMKMKKAFELHVALSVFGYKKTPLTHIYTHIHTYPHISGK